MAVTEKKSPLSQPRSQPRYPLEKLAAGNFTLQVVVVVVRETKPPALQAAEA
jgi:hypothetical protein